MLLSGRDAFRAHRPWMLVFLAGTLASIIWYVWEALERSDLPGGSSRVGFSLGVIGGFLIIFESALWARKKLRGWRLFRTRTWMMAHIWLGLLTVPLLILHCGFVLGGALSATLMIVFLIVILSGVWGLWLQNLVPTQMYLEVPGETIFSKITFVMDQHLNDVRKIIDVRCERLVTDPEFSLPPEERMGTMGSLTMIDLAFSGSLQGKVVTSVAANEIAIPGTRPLRLFFDSQVVPHLQAGRSSKSELANPAQAERRFREVEGILPTEALPVLKQLENLCGLRRQLDHQARLHTWLHNWLCVHLPLTVVLLLLMGVHIFVALRYW